MRYAFCVTITTVTSFSVTVRIVCTHQCICVARVCMGIARCVLVYVYCEGDMSVFVFGSSASNLLPVGRHAGKGRACRRKLASRR